jgi:beta-lactamase regulating signal transducer with metallopeptidase domain
VGFVAILSVWFVRWQRISMSIRNAVPLRDGREWETLRRLERSTGIHKPIALFSSPHSLEPGIFGIVRPVLIWHERISSRLDATHLPSIMAHEICHIQRRDNLAASIHMLVEAIFWFHPLVWWMGTRLVDER